MEDNPIDRDIFTTALTHEGYDVLEAEDGTTGLIQAIELLPDVVILDLMLPGMSGWDIATVLGGLRKTRHIKVLVVSAHQERRKDEDRALTNYVDGYLLKPIDPRELLEHVRRLAVPQ